ncbi:carboxypeptidase-like regulatory domain-containing protein [Fodinibius halophilus]|uniref:Carboxypeptidase regulatory-like domain-containing protein n=1 Tax=Fodinibius halophilus TaxID=1736908 RepID=A0A6M1TCB7_9BACT|nr:carboxypeptidase-like regulatory domain-containing protein [Fodinibius halophilus]NGP89641.1 carboxypeptidase regulatory-like domain-containing protein [Fodinibius halophilus]
MFYRSKDKGETDRTNMHSFFPWTGSVMFVCAVFFLFAVITSCDNSSSADGSKGSITGFVKTNDQWVRPIDEQENVTVSLKGTSNSDRTNADGRFLLEDVRAGIYDISLEKAGFGTMRIPAFSFAGNGQAFIKPGEYTQLSKIPDFTTNIDTIYTDTSFDGDITIDAEGFISATVPHNGLGKVVTLYSTSEDISADPSSYDVFSYDLIRGGRSEYGNQAYLDQFAAPGDTVYVKSYSDSGVNTSYADPETNNMVFANLGDSTKTKQFVVPEAEGSKQKHQQKLASGNIQGWIHFGKETIPIPKDITTKKLQGIQQKIFNKFRQSTSSKR